MTALVWLVQHQLMRLARQPSAVRAAAWPGLLTAGALLGTALLLGRTDPRVLLPDEVAPDLLARVAAAGLEGVQVPDPAAALAEGRGPRAAWRGEDGWVVAPGGSAAEALALEGALRAEIGASWVIEVPPPAGRPADLQTQTGRLAALNLLLFALYGAVLGTADLWADRQQGVLEAQATLPISARLRGLARWLAGSVALGGALGLTLLLLHGIIGLPNVGAWAIHGAIAASTALAIGLHAASGPRLGGLSVPLSRALIGTAGLLGLGLGLPELAGVLPIASVGATAAGGTPRVLGPILGLALAVGLATDRFARAAGGERRGPPKPIHSRQVVSEASPRAEAPICFVGQPTNILTPRYERSDIEGVGASLRRVIAVVRRDLARSGSRKRGLRLLGIALALLLPVAGLRLPTPTPVTGLPAVSGSVPAGLAEQVRLDPDAAVRMEGEAPITVVARQLPPALRSALNSLPGEPALRIERRTTPLHLPGRGLVLALLAISLLTGPLAETLPGERAQGTLEVLLSAAVRRGELVLGKWAAWTGAATMTAAIAVLAGLLRGTLELQPGLLAIPAAIGVAVALGLWLVRRAGDLAGSATVPMRVLPLAAIGLGVLSAVLGSAHPLLGAVIPLGGALLIAGGLLPGAGPLILSFVGAALAIGLLLAGTTRALERQAVRPPATPGAGATFPLLVAAGGVVLGLYGPAVWALRGNPDLLVPVEAGVAAAWGICGAAALLALGRGASLPRGSGGLPRAVLAGALLAMAGGVHAEWAGPALLVERVQAGLVPGGLLPLTLAVLGRELLFRGVLLSALGPLGAAIAWTVLVCPFQPLFGLLSGLALGGVARRSGVVGALLAAAVWLGLAQVAPDLGLPAAVWAGLAWGVAVLRRPGRSW